MFDPITGTQLIHRSVIFPYGLAMHRSNPISLLVFPSAGIYLTIVPAGRLIIHLRCLP